MIDNKMYDFTCFHLVVKEKITRVTQITAKKCMTLRVVQPFLSNFQESTPVI